MIGRASDPLFKLIRVAVIVVAAVAISSGSASAQLRFDLLHSFSASPADGSNSSAPLIQGSDGNFYGTTYNGGSSAKGTVFRITATGNFMVLHSFMGSDGDTPYSSLLQASDGNFYGTTYFGGAFNLGTVYRINATGAFTVIHSFGGVAAGDGARPYYGALIQGTDGNLYGTTYNGGMSSSGNAQGRGTVFRMTLDGATTILYAFTGGTGIAFPYAALLQATDGNLYGTAYAGDLAGNGGIFRINITTGSPTFTPLHNFQRMTEGANPIASLIQATDGFLYGVTHLGGSADQGTVFRMATTGAPPLPVTVVHTFMGNDGAAPDQPLIQAKDGNFYGTTKTGGAGFGTVFKMTPSGTVTTLRSFTGVEGANPFAAVVQMPDGAIYGTTSSGGGSAGAGVIYRLRLTTASGDFDWDTKSDMTVYRPSTGAWWTLNSSSNFTTYSSVTWGTSTGQPMPGDYDGDGRQDMAYWEPSTSMWHILTSSSNYQNHVDYTWGVSTDIPVAGDFDGDGRADLGVWRPSTGTWWVLLSGANFTTYIAQSWGTSGDKPVVGDYDGDGKADLAVWRPSTSMWYVLTSSGGFLGIQWGLSTDVPVVADYDGDHKADMALFRPSTGTWYILTSRNNFTTFLGINWGLSSDTLVPADYDGDGKADPAVWRSSPCTWYILLSSTNYSTFLSQQWGASTDIPVNKRP
jgi:uncharacterized repeat protein (TIGR03803 family)